MEVRSRRWLVEDRPEPDAPGHTCLVRLSCADDDAQGQALDVYWDYEIDRRILEEEGWKDLAARGFDPPRHFAAFLHTLRWNCITATDPNLFQAPFRAGIKIDAYQMEPLRKALLLPRVNLFIADDVGLGKTIEAGLILRELLLRQKVRRVVVSCPPSVVRQWQEEMEQRFGLTFLVFDRSFVGQKRRERGYGVNPWTTHTRFIISHALLRDESYAGPLRDWLGDFSSGALLILDEAHNAAPASGAKYAVDSKLTRVVRDLAPRFEHRLFLSATPHNGHSNSFAALLEILDPQRFCRGVPVQGPKLLDAVMVRRIKGDIRQVEGGFPERRVVPIVIDGLPDAGDHVAPELRLSRLLQDYRRAREARLAKAPRSKQTAAQLVLISLQKRLLSSIEAFACTLRVHRRAVERQLAELAAPGDAPAGKTRPAPRSTPQLDLLASSPGADDERAELAEEEVQAEEEAQLEAAARDDELGDAAQMTRELDLLREMTEVAEAHRHEPDPRVAWFVDWLRDEGLCPGLPRAGDPPPATPPTWTDRRVLLFTEYADTKRYLLEMLESAIAGTDRAGQRIGVFHGGMGEDTREEVKRAFNAQPAKHPLRILVATDAAREGINLQNHCADLFHFDVPWNPSRMEQRNGRIDRKGQSAQEVRCHYFVFRQRPEDRVMEVLVRKTATIQRELGSLSPVLNRHLERLLESGIQHERISGLAAAIDRADQPVGPEAQRARVITEELELARGRQQELDAQLERLRGLLDSSKRHLGLEDRHFRDALCASLELLGAEPLAPADADAAVKDPATARWVFPALDQRAGADPTWAATLDTLRPPRRRDQKPWEWRREAPIREIIFRDPGTMDDETVHLHLEHRVVQRLLGRFLAQGFVHHDLTRACVCLTDDPLPRVLAIGRLSVYGDRAARLHDELVVVAAPWKPPEERRGKLQPQLRREVGETVQLLEDSLATARFHDVPATVRERLRAAAPGDVTELLPHLEARAEMLVRQAETKLAARGDKEAKEMAAILEAQRKRIAGILKKHEDEPVQLELDFSETERRQLEADRRHWKRRLASIAREIVDEPARIRQSYEVRASRVEPAGVVYLWPVSG